MSKKSRKSQSVAASAPVVESDVAQVVSAVEAPAAEVVAEVAPTDSDTEALGPIVAPPAAPPKSKSTPERGASAGKCGMPVTTYSRQGLTPQSPRSVPTP